MQTLDTKQRWVVQGYALLIGGLQPPTELSTCHLASTPDTNCLGAHRLPLLKIRLRLSGSLFVCRIALNGHILSQLVHKALANFYDATTAIHIATRASR